MRYILRLDEARRNETFPFYISRIGEDGGLCLTPNIHKAKRYKNESEAHKGRLKVYEGSRLIVKLKEHPADQSLRARNATQLKQAKTEG